MVINLDKAPLNCFLWSGFLGSVLALETLVVVGLKYSNSSAGEYNKKTQGGLKYYLITEKKETGIWLQ